MKTKNMTTPHLRKSIGRSPLPRGFALIPLVLSCFGLLASAWAVKPPPDGGYARNSTAEGTAALFHNLTTGINNTALGHRALFTNTGGRFNTATGSLALERNENGSFNTATGYDALFSNTTGHYNTATGYQSLFSNIGATTDQKGAGSNNTANGSGALKNNTSGHDNTATGFHALFGNIGATNNTANGSEALKNNTGGNNTAIGFQALLNNEEGEANTAIGSYALFKNAFNPPSYYGHNNTAVGFQALYNNIEGTYNIALGAHAGDALNFFSYWNIDIGNGGVDSESNTIRIGTPPQPGGWWEPGLSGGPSGQSRTFIAGIRGVTTGNDDAIPVVIDSAGQLGTVSSSRRFKTEIKPMDKTSEAILALKPVTFHYKSENSNTSSRRQFGLIAEDVAKLNPDLVVRDKNGQIYTVRYDAVNAMLLNEFLKEHRTVQELKKEIAALTATVQKVSAQVGMSRPCSAKGRG
jgi:hypothetical protein